MRAKTTALGIALTGALAASPALARHEHGADYAGHHPAAHSPSAYGGFPVDRALAERCGLRAGAMRPHLVPASYFEEYGHRGDDGLGGALIGGAIGGVVGNRIAGRGDRTIGTLAGAAIGAAAGAAIDKAEDGRSRAAPAPGYESPIAGADECDAVLPPGYMLVSVPGGQECRDEVVTREEWVPEYITLPPRAAPRGKRTKLRRVK